MPKELSQYCEDYSKLYPGQIKGQKNISAIDIVAMLIHAVQKKQEQKKLARAFFIDVKRTFDHFSKNQLFRQIVKLGIDCDLIIWTGYFFAE